MAFTSPSSCQGLLPKLLINLNLKLDDVVSFLCLLLKALHLHFYTFLSILDCGLKCFYTKSPLFGWDNTISCRNTTSVGDIVKCASINTENM